MLEHLTAVAMPNKSVTKLVLQNMSRISDMYSIMENTTSNISRSYQLSIYISYVDSLKEVSKRILRVSKANDKSGLGFAE